MSVMKHYKDTNTNQIYGYAADGSQDDWIKPGLVLMTDEEFNEFLQQQIQEQQAAEALAAERRADPTQKLIDFLAANPEVANLLNK